MSQPNNLMTPNEQRLSDAETPGNEGTAEHGVG